FASAQLKKKWASLDMDAACQATGHGRSVILRALNDLQERGHVELQMAGYRQRFRRLRPVGDLDALATSLFERFQEFEQREINRIHAMLAYAKEEQCLTGHLLRYFGKDIAHCGHCGPCLGEAAIVLPPRRSAAMPGDIQGALADLVRAHPKALGRPRQRARFLCGLTSPATSATRGLRSNPLFGRCREVPFATVLKACRDEIIYS
ncbi:MAG: RecQ family ATP-dependent DNA helicase, partial [Planctomycetota bacterium]